jgi:hypothetical protein
MNSVITTQFFLSKSVEKWMSYDLAKLCPEIQRIEPTAVVLLTQVA